MDVISIDRRSLEALVAQAELHPPRDAEAQHAVADAKLLLHDLAMTPTEGQLSLFPA